MKSTISLLLLFLSVFVFGQDKEAEKREQLSLKKANSYVYDANELIDADNYISAEKEYRKAISEQPTNVAGTYNLANAYYEKGNYDEALYRLEQASKNATDKSERHKAFHNMGNILMKNKMCKEAVEAFKNALRNDPSDDETRYNLAVAKECAQEQQGKDDQEEKNDENKDDENKDKDKKEDDEKKDDKKDQGDQDKKEGDDKKDEDQKPQDEKDNEKKGNPDDKKEDQAKPKPQPGQLSPQQIKSLLEAMNNNEQKVQEKMNAEKQKGVKVQTEKDW
ncbi:tetratricopeptide repeat protein [Sediminibacter sp. Hel_I_10]|uniref:tetratricopeptide repeat protein n=1 Tax=Sediminibacter sp. Hel_I_10 TaxID=1392490 RepID=UPI00047EF4E0|nr:tetratricopeptide repeat protein [Sediminibacter sp. Hel_I_10]